MRYFSRLLPFSLLLILAGCASHDEELKYSYESEWYEAAQADLERRRWDLAIQKLQGLEENFPFGLYAEQAQLELIYAYYMSNEPEATSAAADRFIRLHPQHRNVDYAYYMKGLAAFNEGKGLFERYFPMDMTRRDPGAARESFNHFSQLIARYPQSEYAPDAKKRMLYLRNQLARYEIHVANYYFKRGAYLAATNRGRFVVENFQLTPAIPDALAVMVQGYQFLDMPDQSQRALDVLRVNYPDHPALDKEGNFNFQYREEDGKSWVNVLTLGLFDKTEPPGFDSRKVYNTEYHK